MMTTSRALLAAVLLAVPLSSCVSLEMSRLRRDLGRDVERQTGVEVGDGFAVGFGRMTMGTARFTSRLVAPSSTRDARQLAGHVRSVKVGRYALRGPFDGRALETPRALRRYNGDGWLPFVVARDSTSAVWIYLRERPDGRLTDLLSVVLGDGDLVLTKVSGNLNDLVLDAVEIGGARDIVSEALGRAGVVPADSTAPPDTEGPE